MTAANVDRVVDGHIVEHGGAANLLELLFTVGAIQIADPVDGWSRRLTAASPSPPAIAPVSRIWPMILSNNVISCLHQQEFRESVTSPGA